jgi:hypothetical protein
MLTIATAPERPLGLVGGTTRTVQKNVLVHLTAPRDQASVASMAHWVGFAQQWPEMAEAGRALLYQFGVGLAFLATTRQDGGPRVHPICPQLYETGLYAFVIPSPKRNDLLRDGRYALHSFPCPTHPKS